MANTEQVVVIPLSAKGMLECLDVPVDFLEPDIWPGVEQQQKGVAGTEVAAARERLHGTLTLSRHSLVLYPLEVCVANPAFTIFVSFKRVRCAVESG